MFEVVEKKSQEAVIKVLGVGGCGGNAVDHMIEKNVMGVEFMCINTDLQALKKSQASSIIQIGEILTKGLGAGSRPDTGKQAAIDDREKIIQAIDGADMLFITAGMGGGTGTGATPVIAEIAKDMGILTIAVVTKPFDFEGSRSQVAKDGINELVNYVDSLIVIPNEKLMGVLGDDVTFIDAFGAANDVLLSAVAGIAEIINSPGLINVDFADVKTVMSEMGMAMIGSGYADGSDRALISSKAAMACPLLEDVNLNNAKGILVNISASQDFKMKEYFEIMNVVKQYAAEDANIIVGNVIDESIASGIRVTMVATGLSAGKTDSSDPVKLTSQYKYDDSETSSQGTAEDEDEVDDEELNVFSKNSDELLNQSNNVGSDKYDIPAYLRNKNK
ncbi:cell division protein FtsZ [Methylophilaceae bacterium]|nr:cell division protein FtsZ [Methylophilaceae bacterium]MDC1173260.1 cell division protein FtsZ [Methylophilaceae bacterium]